MNKKIAIIGAGMSGLILASELSKYANVIVFEKAGGVGGRMATRYAGAYTFDHGAPSFKASNQKFKEFITPLLEQGLIAKWDAQLVNLKPGRIITMRRSDEYLVPVPNMNSLCKHLAKDLNVMLNTKVLPLQERSNTKNWLLYDHNSKFLGNYDLVISTAPAEQTSDLFGNYLSQDCQLLKARMQACFALMLGFNQTWELAWTKATVQGSSLKSITLNSSKPGRNNLLTSIVAYTTRRWSMQHLEYNPEELAPLLTQEFLMLTGLKEELLEVSTVHRWRYALVDKAVADGPYLDKDLKLAAVSDWSQNSKIENVYLQALLLSHNIKHGLL